VDGRLSEVGTLAARRLVRLIQHGADESSQTYVTPKLILRGSTAPVSQATAVDRR